MVTLLTNYSPDQQESMLKYGVLIQKLMNGMHKLETMEPRQVVGGGISRGGIAKFGGYVDKFVLFSAQLRMLSSREKHKRIYHVVDHSNSLYLRSVHKRNVRIATCHDLLAVRAALGEFPGVHVRGSGKIYQKLVVDGLKQADLVLAVSEKTKEDLVRVAGIDSNRVRICYNSINWDYKPVSEISAEVSAQVGKFSTLAGGRPIIMHIGGNQWYKNRRAVIEIFETLCKLNKDAVLFMAGKMPSPELQALWSKSQHRHRIFWVGRLSEHELNALYVKASVLLFPSLEEGFGWPILEALQAGCRVVAVNKAPMNEIGGRAVSYLPAIGCWPDCPGYKNWVESAARVVAEVMREDLLVRQQFCLAGWEQIKKFDGAVMREHLGNAYAEAEALLRNK